MNIFNKYPKGVSKDNSGVVRYPDGTPFEGMEDAINESLNEQSIIQDNVEIIKTKQEAVIRIKELSELIHINQKMANAEEINILRNKFNLTANELDSLLGKNGWINYKEGKVGIFPKGLH